VLTKRLSFRDIDTNPAWIVKPESRGRMGREGQVGRSSVVWDGLRHAVKNVKNVRMRDENEETSFCSPL